MSATVTNSVNSRRGYDRVLELFSQPLRRTYAPALRYPDMTDHVEYPAQGVQSTIEQEMRKEAGYLRGLRTASERVKQVLEGPDGDIDRIIRSVREKGDKVSNNLPKEILALTHEDLAAELMTAIQAAFAQP